LAEPLEAATQGQAIKTFITLAGLDFRKFGDELWSASMAYVLLDGLRRMALQATDLADATCGTIRRKLFKIGALVTISVRRIKLAMASGCPYKQVFAIAHRALAAAEYPSP
jgi:hypothetical protein